MLLGDKTLPRTYLTHHELESVTTVMIIIIQMSWRLRAENHENLVAIGV